VTTAVERQETITKDNVPSIITEVGAEQNTMTIVMMPSEFVAMARSIAEMAKRP